MKDIAYRHIIGMYEGDPNYGYKRTFLAYLYLGMFNSFIYYSYNEYIEDKVEIAYYFLLTFFISG